MKKAISLLCFAGLLAVGLLYATEPATNIDPAKHPSLAKAQLLINQSFDKIVAAQKANEFDLGGHAVKAKALLEKSSKELKLAAIEVNKNPGAGAGSAPEAQVNPTENAPAQNISESKHPNLAQAQQFLDTAYTKIVEAQKANDFDMKGHAVKAKDYLEQANKELKLAAEEANTNK